MSAKVGTTFSGDTPAPPGGHASIGDSVLRREDIPILTGETLYTDDLAVPGALWLAVLRSPHARARVRSVDTEAAKAAPGVVTVRSGADMEPEWTAPIPLLFMPPGVELKQALWEPIAVNAVNYVGESVAVVVAESRAQAIDALEAIEVDYEPLPAVVDPEDAYSDREVIYSDLGTNKAYTFPIHIDEAAVDAAFASAAHTVKQRHVQQRVLPAAMEPRAVCVIPERSGMFTVYSSTQMVHMLRTLLAMTTGVPEQKLRVVAPAVGGGFGSKLQAYPEDLFCLVMSRALKKPVRWVEERSVNALATIHGRGQVQEIEVAADAEGKITAVRANLIADIGAHNMLFSPAIPVIGGAFYHGCYDVRNYSVTITAVYTNLPPTDAYRGAGRPEATYAIERAIEALAVQMGMDPAEIRRRNFIPPFANGHTTVCMVELDSGNYGPALERALELADYDQLRKEQATRRASAEPTRHIGIGLAAPFEICGYAPSKLMAAGGAKFSMWRLSTVKLLPTGKVIVTTGSHPHGQGHETSWAQIVSHKLGVPMEDVEVLANDTYLVPFGNMTGGSRSLAVEGSALTITCEKVIEKARLLAAHLLEANEHDLEFKDGTFAVKGTPQAAIGLADLAYISSFEANRLPDGMEANLGGETVWDPPNFTFPFGTRLVAVEVDEETGGVEILKFVAVDDCGVQLNPMIVHGQVHGGLVQGIGQALFEHAAYDADGNPQATTFADYLVPSAAEIPSFLVDSTVTPSPSNPLGAKGVGESGIMGAAPAVINAIVDALAPLGVTNILMPASPQTVWRAIQAAKAEIAGRTGMIPAAFDYVSAESVEDALSHLTNYGEDAKLLAGGHSLIPLMKLRFASPSVLVDVGGLGELSYVRDAGDHVAVGALSRYRDLETNPLLREQVPILAHVSGVVGDPQVRHRGTIGGSLAHGDPASDLPAVVLALGGTLVARSPRGERTIAATDFFTGFLETALAPDEMLTEIRVPKVPDAGWSFQKFNRRAIDWAIVGVAAVSNGSTNVALINMAPTPMRAFAVEEALAGGAPLSDAAARAAEGAQPPSDANAEPDYRRHLAQVLVRRALQEAGAGA